jgi:hypothetical protein
MGERGAWSVEIRDDLSALITAHSALFPHSCPTFSFFLFPFPFVRPLPFVEIRGIRGLDFRFSVSGAPSGENVGAAGPPRPTILAGSNQAHSIIGLTRAGGSSRLSAWYSSSHSSMTFCKARATLMGSSQWTPPMNKSGQRPM